jgi:uncharacterized membrane protein
MHSIDILTIVAAGLMTGNELTVSLFINPVMRRLEPTAQTHALSLFAGLLGRVMPFWYGLCLILFVAETWVRRGQVGFPFLLAASILWALTIVFTIALLVPINNRIAALAASAPLEQWLPEHRRWNRLHCVRIVLLLVALVFVLHALLPR